MHEIATTRLVERRGSGALAFSVGGADVLLTPRAARAQAVPLRTLSAGASRNARCAWRDARARRARRGIAHFIDQQTLDPAGGGTAGSAHPQCAPALCQFLSRRACRRRSREPGAQRRPRLRAAQRAEQRSFVDDMRQNKVEGWQGPADRSSTCCCAATQSMSSTGPWMATPPLAFPTWPHIAPTQEVVTMAQRKSRRRRRRRGRFRLGVCRGAGAGRARRSWCSSRARTGNSSDLISSDFWGRRVKPASGPFCSKARTRSATSIRRVGASAVPRCIILPISRGCCRTISRSRASTAARLDWPISYQDVAPYYDKVAQDVGVSGDAKAEEIWRPAGEPYPMPPMKTFRNGEVWLKGFEAVGIRMVPAAVGMNSTDYKGRPACIYDGWCHVGCPIGALANPLVTYLGDAQKSRRRSARPLDRHPGPDQPRKAAR